MWRNKIDIKLKHDSYWLSIVEITADELFLGRKEMALVRRSDSSFMGISIVPLHNWFDSSEYDEVIDLANCASKRYHLLCGASEGEVVAQAIIRANKFIDDLSKVEALA